MSKKKSYMDRENLINEGFFSKLFKKHKIKDKDVKEKVMKAPKVKKALADYQKSVRDLEEYISKISGKKVDLKYFSTKDYMKR